MTVKPVWYSGPCHGPTRFFGTAQISVFGPVELHHCQICGASLISRIINHQRGWMESRQFQHHDPAAHAALATLVQAIIMERKHGNV
jgi:hypothetical protein